MHPLTDAAGMPLAHRTPPAHGQERAHVLPRLDAVHLRTGQPGRPRQRPTVGATDQGDDAKAWRLQRRHRGIRAQRPKRVGQTKPLRGRPLTRDVPRVQAARPCAGFHRQDRRVGGRWDRLVACLVACLAMATTHLWIHRLIVG
jgi:hypothetical protein